MPNFIDKCTNDLRDVSFAIIVDVLKRAPHATVVILWDNRQHIECLIQTDTIG